MDILHENIEPDYDGKKPLPGALRKWVVDGMWDAWADTLDAQAIKESDELLIQKKVLMLQRHQQDAAKLADKARDYLLDEGFDTSAAAVNAYFRATEEQRKIEGFSDLLERIEKMKNDELSAEIITMLNRASENDQIIEGNIKVPELEDGEENDTED